MTTIALILAAPGTPTVQYGDYSKVQTTAPKVRKADVNDAKLTSDQEMLRGLFKDQAAYGRALYAEGSKYLGTPYKWGGNDLRRGIDCSHFVSAVIKRVGKITISAPVHSQETKGAVVLVNPKISKFHRGSQTFNAEGYPTDPKLIMPGDRVVRQDASTNTRHDTGIYVGDVVRGGKAMKSMVLLAKGNGVKLMTLANFKYTIVLRDW